MMNPTIFLYIDWNRGLWAVQFRNESGNITVELTDYPASMPSLVVSDAIQKARPGSTILARLA